MRAERQFIHYPAQDTNLKIEDRGLAFRNLGIVLYCVGVLLGLVVLGVSVYGDFEGSLFDFPHVAGKSIRPFSCPLLIDSDEVGIVQATVRNESPERIQRTITANFTQVSSTSIREEPYHLTFEPNESQDIYWFVSGEDALDSHLILVNVFASALQSTPAGEAGCGVFVFDLPGRLTGTQVTVFILVVSFVFMFGGAYLWRLFKKPKKKIKREETWSIIGVIVIILAGLVTDYFGLFGLTVVIFYSAMLLVGVLVPHLIFSRLRA